MLLDDNINTITTITTITGNHNDHELFEINNNVEQIPVKLLHVFIVRNLNIRHL